MSHLSESFDVPAGCTFTPRSFENFSVRKQAKITYYVQNSESIFVLEKTTLSLVPFETNGTFYFLQTGQFMIISKTKTHGTEIT